MRNHTFFDIAIVFKGEKLKAFNQRLLSLQIVPITLEHRYLQMTRYLNRTELLIKCFFYAPNGHRLWIKDGYWRMCVSTQGLSRRVPKDQLRIPSDWIFIIPDDNARRDLVWSVAAVRA